MTGRPSCPGERGHPWAIAGPSSVMGTSGAPPGCSSGPTPKAATEIDSQYGNPAGSVPVDMLYSGQAANRLGTEYLDRQAQRPELQIWPPFATGHDACVGISNAPVQCSCRDRQLFGYTAATFNSTAAMSSDCALPASNARTSSNNRSSSPAPPRSPIAFAIRSSPNR
jgi:hypothetical protein